MIIITGDVIGHMNNNKRRFLNTDKYSYETFTRMMSTHQQISSMLHEQYPNAVVIPTFGNNDFDLDDEVANET